MVVPHVVVEPTAPFVLVLLVRNRPWWVVSEKEWTTIRRYQEWFATYTWLDDADRELFEQQGPAFPLAVMIEEERTRYSPPPPPSPPLAMVAAEWPHSSLSSWYEWWWWFLLFFFLLSFVSSSCGCFRVVFLATACGTSRKDETIREVRIVSLDT